MLTHYEPNNLEYTLFKYLFLNLSEMIHKGLGWVGFDVVWFYPNIWPKLCNTEMQALVHFLDIVLFYGRTFIILPKLAEQVFTKGKPRETIYKYHCLLSTARFFSGFSTRSQ